MLPETDWANAHGYMVFHSRKERKQTGVAVAVRTDIAKNGRVNVFMVENASPPLAWRRHSLGGGRSGKIVSPPYTFHPRGAGIATTTRRGATSSSPRAWTHAAAISHSLVDACFVLLPKGAATELEAHRPAALATPLESLTRKALLFQHETAWAPCWVCAEGVARDGSTGARGPSRG